MGMKQLRALREVIPECGLSITSRAALFWLCEGAREATSLTWVSQATLGRLIGCAGTYVGEVLAPVEAAGMVSIDRSPGRAPVFLVHPLGRARFDPVAGTDMRAHMREGRFSKARIAAVMAWLADIGAVSGDNPSTQSKGSQRGTAPFNPVEHHPSTGSNATLRLGRNDPEGTRIETRRAGPRPANMGGLAGPPAEQDASETRDWATPEILASLKAAPHQPTPERGA